MQDKELQVKSTSQMLEEGLKEVFSTAHYQRFLSFVANNSNYSYRNAILILQQCPHATRTMGFKGWRKEGRMVMGGQRGLRINACFEKEEENKEQLPVPPSRKKRRHQEDSTFRRVSVFDISQTAALDGAGDCGNATPPIEVPSGLFEAARLEGNVNGYETIVADLSKLAPLPILFRSGMKVDGSSLFNGILIKKDMSQLHTIRTIVHQIAYVWLRSGCPDRGQLAMQAESVAFIVCRYLGLDTSTFSFQHIAQYSFGRERNLLEKFLSVIQKTALYFIDTLDGIHTARRIGYTTGEYFLFANRKTALRLFRQGYDLYLVYPEQGELLVMNKKILEQYDGPFAVPYEAWFGAGQMAA